MVADIFTKPHPHPPPPPTHYKKDSYGLSEILVNECYLKLISFFDNFPENLGNVFRKSYKVIHQTHTTYN